MANAVLALYKYCNLFARSLDVPLHGVRVPKRGLRNHDCHGTLKLISFSVFTYRMKRAIRRKGFK